MNIYSRKVRVDVRDERNNTVAKALALHTANPGSIPSIPYGSLVPLGEIPEFRDGSNP